MRVALGNSLFARTFIASITHVAIDAGWIAVAPIELDFTAVVSFMPTIGIGYSTA